MRPLDDNRQRVYLDLTHVGRHITGIERIAIDLFDKVAFENAQIIPVRAKGLIGLIFKQQVAIPFLALTHPKALFVFPGFPPSPLMSLWRERVVHYVHDLFLVTRRADLGLKARLYMAWPFKRAVTRLKHFLVNSEKTRAELQPFVSRDATIGLYRPAVGNVFGIDANDRACRPDATPHLRLVAIGTVEPRKNLAYAANIRDALAALATDMDVSLQIIGRAGWGGDAERLTGRQGVELHGYLPLDQARSVIDGADVYLTTSHDEGLGLPLLEVQYAGLLVVAPDIAVFREVLDESGLLIPRADAAAAAQAILAEISTPGWRRRSVAAARANLARWNGAARVDAERARRLFAEGHPMMDEDTSATVDKNHRRPIAH